MFSLKYALLEILKTKLFGRQITARCQMIDFTAVQTVLFSSLHDD